MEGDRAKFSLYHGYTLKFTSGSIDETLYEDVCLHLEKPKLINRLVMNGCRNIDYDVFLKLVRKFEVRTIQISMCLLDFSRLSDFFQQMESIDIESDNDQDYDSICQIVETCKNMKMFSFGFSAESHDGMKRLIKAIGNSNIVSLTCSDGAFAPFLGEFGTMLKSCKTLEELLCSDVVTESTIHQVKHDDWIAFCDGVMSSQLQTLYFSTECMSPTQVNTLLSAITKNKSLKEAANIYCNISKETFPFLKEFINHVESLDFRIMTYESSELLESFATLISDSTSLRCLNLDLPVIFNSGHLTLIIEQNGFILDGLCSTFEMNEMTRRNYRNLRRCKDSCETLLALKKFRSPKINLGHDMTKLLSQYLFKTWGDAEAYEMKTNNNKKQKI